MSEGEVSLGGVSSLLIGLIPTIQVVAGAIGKLKDAIKAAKAEAATVGKGMLASLAGP